MADTPLNVTEHDVADKNLLLRFLRKIASTISGITQRISAVEAAPKPLTPAEISRQLSATGAAPLNVQNLLGTLRQPQVPGPQRTTSVPTGQVLQQLQDTQLIISSTDNGTTYNLYQVVAGNPNALIKLIGGVGSTSTSGGGNYMTLDTVQTVTTSATKTVNSVWTFSTQLFGGAGSAAAPQYTFSSSTQSGVFSPALNQLGLSAAGTEVIHVSSSGNVGIGMTPAGKLDVAGTIFGNAGFANSIPGLKLGYGNFGTAIWMLHPAASGHYNWNITSDFNVTNALEITPSTAVDGTTFSTPALVVLPSGNVGIGTIPTSFFDLGGNTQFSTGGVVTKYHTLNTAGEGVPYILYSNTISGNTTNLPAQTTYTATAAGDYRFNYYAFTTATGTGGPVTVSALWHDGIGTKNPTLNTFNLGINTYTNGSQYLRLGSGQALSFSVTATITAGGYTVDASLERIS